MSVIRSRAVNRSGPRRGSRRRNIAAEITAVAQTEGVHYYAMYVDEAQRLLINLAEYADEAAWRNWIATNRPRGTRLMETVDLVSMEAYGTLTPELSDAITSYGDSVVYAPLAS